MGNKNVLFTGLSLVKINPSCSVVDLPEGRRITSNYESEEPGAKYILHNQRISRIVIVGTEQTVNPDRDMEIYHIDSLTEWYTTYCQNNDVHINAAERKWEDNSGNKISSYELFLRRIAAYILEENLTEEEHSFIEAREPDYEDSLLCPNEENQKNPIEVIFVPDRIEGEINYIGLLQALRGGEAEPFNIFMDVQGSGRSITFARNTVLQLISKQNIYHATLKQVIATDYNPSEHGSPMDPHFKNKIVDETKSFRISELFAGVSSFLRYGKVDDIEKYMLDTGVNNCTIHAVVDAMKRIDRAISVNNLISLTKSIEKLKGALDSFEASDNQSDHEFRILIEGIKEDYAPLLKDNWDIIDALKWCISKNIYLTAAAFIESKLPEYIFKNGMITISDMGLANSYLTFYKDYVSEKNLARTISKPWHFILKSYIEYYEGLAKDNVGLFSNNDTLAINLSCRVEDVKLLNILLHEYYIVCVLRNTMSHPGGEIEPKYRNLLSSNINYIAKSGMKLQVAHFQNLNNISSVSAQQSLLTRATNDILLLAEQLGKRDAVTVCPEVKTQCNASDIRQIVSSELCKIDKAIESSEKDSYSARLQRKKDKVKSYLLTSIILPIKMLEERSEKLTASYSDKKAYINNDTNAAFLELVIGYINEKYDEDFDYNGLKNAASAKVKSVSEGAILNKILTDETCLKKLMDSEEKTAVLKEMITGLRDEMSGDKPVEDESINQIFDYLLGTDFDWKDVVNSYLVDDEHIKRMLEIMWPPKQ